MHGVVLVLVSHLRQTVATATVERNGGGGGVGDAAVECYNGVCFCACNSSLEGAMKLKFAPFCSS